MFLIPMERPYTQTDEWRRERVHWHVSVRQPGADWIPFPDHRPFSTPRAVADWLDRLTLQVIGDRAVTLDKVYTGITHKQLMRDDWLGNMTVLDRGDTLRVAIPAARRAYWDVLAQAVRDRCHRPQHYTEPFTCPEDGDICVGIPVSVASGMICVKCLSGL